MPDAVEATPSSEAVPSSQVPRVPAVAALTALGVVYGDIGTSPLYALKQAADSGGALSPATVFGIVSLIAGSQRRTSGLSSFG